MCEAQLIIGQIYACAITPASYLQRIEGGIFDKQEYYKSPDKYMSIFAAKVSASESKISSETLT